MPKKDIKNEYNIRDGIVYIQCKYKEEKLVCLIDEMDFPLLQETGNTVTIKNTKSSYTYYARIRKDGRCQTVHRIIINTKKGLEVDHIDRNGLNNTRCNLRAVTHSVNMLNRREPTFCTKNRKSRKVGKGTIYVDKPTGKFRGCVIQNKKRHQTGRYITLPEARKALDVIILELTKGVV